MAYTYDNSRVTGMTYSAGSTQLGNLSYTYDADGRRIGTGGSLAAVNLAIPCHLSAFLLASSDVMQETQKAAYRQQSNVQS